LANFTPRFSSRESYFAVHDRLSSAGDRIFYDADGNATVKL
jgi:hypothetical protein